MTSSKASSIETVLSQKLKQKRRIKKLKKLYDDYNLFKSFLEAEAKRNPLYFEYQTVDYYFCPLAYWVKNDLLEKVFDPIYYKHPDYELEDGYRNKEWKDFVFWIGVDEQGNIINGNEKILNGSLWHKKYVEYMDVQIEHRDFITPHKALDLLWITIVNRLGKELDYQYDASKTIS